MNLIQISALHADRDDETGRPLDVPRLIANAGRGFASDEQRKAVMAKLRGGGGAPSPGGDRYGSEIYAKKPWYKSGKDWGGEEAARHSKMSGLEKFSDALNEFADVGLLGMTGGAGAMSKAKPLTRLTAADKKLVGSLVSDPKGRKYLMDLWSDSKHLFRERGGVNYKAGQKFLADVVGKTQRVNPAAMPQNPLAQLKAREAMLQVQDLRQAYRHKEADALIRGMGDAWPKYKGKISTPADDLRDLFRNPYQAWVDVYGNRSASLTLVANAVRVAVTPDEAYLPNAGRSHRRALSDDQRRAIHAKGRNGGGSISSTGPRQTQPPQVARTLPLPVTRNVIFPGTGGSSQPSIPRPGHIPPQSGAIGVLGAPGYAPGMTWDHGNSRWAMPQQPAAIQPTPAYGMPTGNHYQTIQRPGMSQPMPAGYVQQQEAKQRQLEGFRAQDAKAAAWKKKVNDNRVANGLAPIYDPLEPRPNDPQAAARASLAATRAAADNSIKAQAYRDAASGPPVYNQHTGQRIYYNRTYLESAIANAGRGPISEEQRRAIFAKRGGKPTQPPMLATFSGPSGAPWKAPPGSLPMTPWPTNPGAMTPGQESLPGAPTVPTIRWGATYSPATGGGAVAAPNPVASNQAEIDAAAKTRDAFFRQMAARGITTSQLPPGFNIPPPPPAPIYSQGGHPTSAAAIAEMTMSGARQGADLALRQFGQNSAQYIQALNQLQSAERAYGAAQQQSPSKFDPMTGQYLGAGAYSGGRLSGSESPPARLPGGGLQPWIPGGGVGVLGAPGYAPGMIWDHANSRWANPGTSPGGSYQPRPQPPQLGNPIQRPIMRPGLEPKPPASGAKPPTQTRPVLRPGLTPKPPSGNVQKPTPIQRPILRPGLTPKPRPSSERIKAAVSNYLAK